MNRTFTLAVALALTSVAALYAAQQTAAPASAPPRGARGPARDITQVTGPLYRARNGNWATILLVTSDGIILGDPIGTEFATWLKAQLAERFKVPVRYVVYSHSHFDHASGGAVFADTARFIAHEHMARNMDGRFPHMPGDMIDRNANGRFDAEEISIPTNAAPGVCGWGPTFFTMFDRDKDGQVTPAELQADIRRPDIYYSDRMRLELGGEVVELIHPGLNHSDDATVMFFPAHRVVFATEFLADALVTTSMRSLPSGCGPFDGNPLAEWIKSYRTVEALDFDVLAPGHGGLFSKKDVTETRQYFEDLVAEVSAGIKAGKTMEQLEQSVMLEKYKDWAQYARVRVLNVRGAYRNLTTYR